MIALEPAILTIFGITGDLAHRKLLPALYHLAHDQLLPDPFRIVGVTRRGTTVPEIIAGIRASVEAGGEMCDDKTLSYLAGLASVVKMDITEHQDYAKLKLELDKIEEQVGVCLNRLFYLAIPSTVFGSVVERLGDEKLNTGCQHGTAESRLLIEKPFGYDMASAQELVDTLSASFKEEQIYRIDHYLAKETAQNIATFRFENPLFQASWDNKHVSRILITAAESIGIEGRVSFYEPMGALRDIVQSHLLQLLALVTMDKPESTSADATHQAKVSLLNQVKPPAPNQMTERTVRGQYQGYLQEVDGQSTTETYAAIQLEIDSLRWRDVPVILRTGKQLTQKTTEITITFHDPQRPGCTNYLTMRIQPNEGIELSLRIKRPGYEDAVEDVRMEFYYGGALNVTNKDAYERVLVDVLRRDTTLFATSDEVLASWRITEPILEAWSQNQVPLEIYAAGSWGPQSAADLVKNLGGEWLAAAPNTK